MDRRRLSTLIGAPGALLAAAAVLAIAGPASWGWIPMVVAVLTAPLWSLAGLRRARSEAEHDALVASYNLQLSAIVAFAASAVLILLFIGILLIYVVVVVECAWSVAAARRVWRNERVVVLRGVHAFKPVC